ncbi:MAG: VOC family protein [Myxococcaceae bacterium]|nr:VOC family protein [Myxococcaceae bacterium]
MAAKKGRFTWYDLMTSDLAAARSFYSQVIGWKTQKWEQGDYEMWTVDGQALGGMMPLPDEVKKAGGPPHWLAYIETDDVDATAKRAQQLGGQVHRPPTDIPSVGRFAVLADPQGAAFAIFKPLEPGEDAPRKAGFIGWHELNTTDYQAAWKFYSELFGWKNTSSMDMGPELGAYWMFGTSAEQAMGGMSNAARQFKMPPHWMYYVTVDDLDAAVERVKKNGGKIINGPMEVPGGDRIVQCMDPQGAAFSLFAVGKK